MTHEGRALARCTLGLACLLAAVDFLLWGGAFTMHGHASTFTSEDIRLLYTVPGMVVLGVALVAGGALAHGRGASRAACVAGAAGMLLADALLGALHVTGTHSLGLLAVAGALSGVGIALSLLAWRAALARLGREERVRAVSAACLLFPFVPLSFTLTRTAWCFVVAGALCALAPAALLRARAAAPAAAPAGAPVPGESRRHLREAAPAVSCLASLGFVAGIARTSALSAESGSAGVMWWSLGCMFALALALLVVWRVLGASLTVVRFYQAGFALTATGLVAALVVANGFTAMLACFPYLFLEFALVLVMAADDAPAGSAPGAGLLAFGAQTGAAYLALALGTGLGLALCRGEGGASTAFGLTIALCVYALSVPLVVLLGRRSVAPAQAPAPAAPPEPRDIYAARARRLADEYGLTPREEQIVVLVACGLDAPALARELGVSDNTVRTHRRNAYRKLGAHSKQDVLALLAAEAGVPEPSAPGPMRP